jgi:TonB family protein
VDGNPEVAISFVGYSTLKVKASDIGNKPLKLEATNYTMDLETVPITVIKEDNDAITTKADDVTLSPKEAKKISDQQKSGEDEEGVFFIVEDMPMFPGGKAALKTYIYSSLEYPAEEKKKGISGEVAVKFMVTTSGKLDHIEVVSSTHKAFEKAALGVFDEMPLWTPGAQRGKSVNVYVVIPVKFYAEKV